MNYDAVNVVVSSLRLVVRQANPEISLRDELDFATRLFAEAHQQYSDYQREHPTCPCGCGRTLQAEA